MAINNQQVKIEITDKVPSSIASKFNNIAKSAREAGRGVEQLNKAVAGIKSTGLSVLASALKRAAQATSQASTSSDKAAASAAKLAIANQKLATESARTSTEMNRSAVAGSNNATALQRLQTELQRTNVQAAKAAIEQQKLATETAKTTNANNQAAVSLQRLQTEQARTSQVLNNAALAAQRLVTEQQRLQTEQQRTALTAQRVATEVQRTAIAESNAAIAALRLAQAERDAEAAASGLNLSMGGLLGTIGAIVGIGFGLDSLIKIADGYTNLQNRLRTLATSQEQVNLLTNDMFELANNTRSSVDATAESFVRFDRALAYMGKSQSDTLRMTETINKALLISGTSSQESASALLQLSQAFNAGKLQGDEFRSVSENMPIVLDYVAKAAGKSRSEIKKMSSDGQIDAQLMYKAFQLMGSQVDAAFSKLQPTVEQATTVFTNNWKRFVGELDQSTGTSRALANAIVFLGNHLKELAVAAAVVGAALLVAFGPALLSALSAASEAMIAFTVSLAANPVGALIVAITGAIAALYAYGNQIEVIKESHVTLLDEGKGAFLVIGDAAVSVCDYINGAWASMIQSIFGTTQAFGIDFSNIFNVIFQYLKLQINGVINVVVASFRTVVELLNGLVDACTAINAAIYNGVLKVAESFVDIWTWTVKKVASLVSYFDESAAKSMTDAVDNMSVHFERMQSTSFSKGGIDRVVNAWTTGLKNDPLGDFGHAVNERAKDVAKLRQETEKANKGATLRGTGVNQNKAVAGKTKKTDAQKAYERDLRNIKKPQTDYNASIAAANTLLSRGEISQGRYNALIEKASDKYKGATEPLYKYNKETQKQLELYSKVGPEATALSVIQQQKSAALEAGLPWEEKYNEQILNQVKALDAAKTKHDVMNTIYEETTGKQTNLIQQQLAYNEAVNKGALSFEQYQIATQKLNVEMANLKLKMGQGTFDDVMTSSLGSLVSNYDGVMKGLSDSFGQFFSSFTDGFANSIGQAIVQGDSLSETLTNVARSGVQELISSLVKLGIQYIINSTLASTSIATSTATSAAAAAATTAAWTPAAAAVSIATFGAAAAAGTASMVASVGSITATMTAMSAGGMAGFKEGGYTGDYARDQIAGVVHGQEHVLTADTTARIGRSKLDSLNNGASLESVSQNSQATSNNTTNNFYFNTNNDIDMQGAKGDSDEASLDLVLQKASQLTQQQIADSMRRGGPWASLIRQVATK